MRRTLEMTVVEGIKTSIPLHLEGAGRPRLHRGQVQHGIHGALHARAQGKEGLVGRVRLIESRAVTAIPDPFRRLYAILDLDAVTGRAIPAPDLLDAWLDAGVTLIQLRAKHLTFGPFVDLAAPMAERCRAAGATFVVNDRADVAALSGAHGVHVGQDDLPVDAARRLVGEGIVGVSTHTQEQVLAALQTTADYLAIGPVFATRQQRTRRWPGGRSSRRGGCRARDGLREAARSWRSEASRSSRRPA
jgi:thiamine-phosphate diphosphorylase